MLDPLSALGVAAAVVQFVQFGSDIVGSGLSLYKSRDGALDENIRHESISAHLKHLAAQFAGESSSTPGIQDKKLWVLACDCESLCGEMLELLDSLKIHGSRFRSWNAVRQAVRSVWKAEKVRRMQEHLDRIRAELALSLMTVLE